MSEIVSTTNLRDKTFAELHAMIYELQQRLDAREKVYETWQKACRERDEAREVAGRLATRWTGNDLRKHTDAHHWLSDTQQIEEKSA